MDYGEDSSMGFYGQARSTTRTPRAGRLHPAPERARRLLDAASGPWPSRLRGLARGPRTSGSTEIQIQIQRTRARGYVRARSPISVLSSPRSRYKRTYVPRTVRFRFRHRIHLRHGQCSSLNFQRQLSLQS